MSSELFDFSPRLTVIPVIHGSGDFAVAVRRRLLMLNPDCLAVPLPATWSDEVLEAVEELPRLTAVVQPWEDRATYVPIDPCQPVISSLRMALGERMSIEWIDWETLGYEPTEAVLPDPYSLRGLSLEQFAGTVLTFLPPPIPGSFQESRCRRQAFELHRVEIEHGKTVALVNIMDWPWIRHAYMRREPYPEHETFFEPIRSYPVDTRSAAFFLSELPFITALYETRRQSLDDDENLSVDGVKELLLAARDRWQGRRTNQALWITPKLLGVYLQYVRNLMLAERRLAPDLYTLVVAAKQIAGDGFARDLLETAREYTLAVDEDDSSKSMRMGVDQATLSDSGTFQMVNRLPGIKRVWRRCALLPEPPDKSRSAWQMLWDPFQGCSWPPEDQKIESFHTHVRAQAKAILGSDLARTEKFTSSVKDGVDLRETLRHWYSGDIYVREIPPARGGLEVVVFLFDVPSDPQKYAWRTTWHAEHDEESTIAFFCTDFHQDMVGPGIGRARYGGVFFIFPPRLIPDIWTDPRVPNHGPLEEQLISAAVLHSQAPHIAVVSPVPLKATWRRIARQRKKKLVHIPLSRFSGRTIDQIRTVHVLNGKQVRSYAARFIQEG